MSTKITVAAGPHDRYYTPVTVKTSVPRGAKSAALNPWRENRRSDDIFPPPIVAEIGEADGEQQLTFIVPRLPRNTTETYEVTYSDDPEANGVTLDALPNGDVDIAINGETLGRYHGDAKWVRPFINPVIGPFGQSVTRGWPADGRPGEAEDHEHHKSIWIAHGDVNGVDNWSEEANCGRQVQRERLASSSGPVVGVLETVNDWVSNIGSKVVEDRRKFTFYAASKSVRIIDVEVEFTATEGPVRFGDTKEGGILAVRVATTMDVPRTGIIVNAEGGTNESETWGKRSVWCDYSGLDDGGHLVGVAVFNHPSSNRFPTYWHVRNYGLMTANPYGLGDFYGDKSVDGSQSIEAGERLTFGYRVYVHAGDAVGGHVGEAYHGYVNPPVATED